MKYPQSYSKDAYLDWHHAKWPGDAQLIDRLQQEREELKKKSTDQLNFLANLLEYLGSYCQTEYKTAKHIQVAYKTPLTTAMSAIGSSDYDLLFKSVDSLINKLWRKNNSENPTLELSHISRRITDLVRTEMVWPTLDSARFAAERIRSLPANIHNPDIKSQFEARIETVELEPEMKMESGYFAYHALFRFKGGLTVELQLYSDLSRIWRNLSHKVYDRVRGEHPQKMEFGTEESRLVSLGHLLHLAECEIQRLESEIA
jgi:ppGpp synthetase/RelA/SpoT-type nucleotidyltranferase